MEEQKRAYISVYDKTGIVEFTRYLVEYGYQIIATDGTRKVLTDAGIDALSTKEAAGTELGGLVRTVNPIIYAGICAKKGEDVHPSVKPIDLVIINLYPFKEDIEAGVPFEKAVTHIDEGGVTLLSAAARNYGSAVAVCDREDYDRVLCDLAAGELTKEESLYFMYKAFSYVASYNAVVSQYLSRIVQKPYPKMFTMTYEKVLDMRYGENPHQSAAIYREPLLKEGSLARAKQLAGPVPTYNNYHDANAALELVKEFDGPAVAACRHCTPFSAGIGENINDAFEGALNADPLRFQGGIIAINGVVDARIASSLKTTGAEFVVAVGFTPEAMSELKYNEKLVLLEMPNIRSKVLFSTYDVHKIYGGLLVQTYDLLSGKNARCVTKRKPTESEIKALNFNYKVAKHSRSSAVVIGRETATVGVGSGLTSRQIALETAIALAGEGNTKGCVLASDSDIMSSEFIRRCHEVGISAIIQPGILEADVISLCDEYKIAMLCTDERHVKN